MQIHNVFCLSFETLSRVLCALRLNLPPPAQLINGLPTYLVRRLMEVRRGRRLQCFVNWEGYMLEEPSWVPQSAILDKTMLRDNHPDKPGGSPEGSCLGATLTVLKSFCASLSLSLWSVWCVCVCAYLLSITPEVIKITCLPSADQSATTYAGSKLSVFTRALNRPHCETVSDQ